MKKYEDLEVHIKEWLEDIVAEDEYGLQAESLYNNILHSSGSDETLSELFAVPVSLVRAIKREEE